MTAEANLTRIEDPVVETTSCLLTGTITSDDGVTGFVPTTCTLTLYDVTSGSIINSRSGVSIISSVAAGGVLSLALGILDNVLVDSTKEREWHRALIVWTWSSGAKKGAYTIEYAIEANAKL